MEVNQKAIEIMQEYINKQTKSLVIYCILVAIPESGFISCAVLFFIHNLIPLALGITIIALLTLIPVYQSLSFLSRNNMLWLKKSNNLNCADDIIPEDCYKSSGSNKVYVIQGQNAVYATKSKMLIPYEDVFWVYRSQKTHKYIDKQANRTAFWSNLGLFIIAQTKNNDMYGDACTATFSMNDGRQFVASNLLCDEYAQIMSVLKQHNPQVEQGNSLRLQQLWKNYKDVLKEEH